jgi:hypothetical protein
VVAYACNHVTVCAKLLPAGISVSMLVRGNLITFPQLSFSAINHNEMKPELD